jgi:hypothetical protein
VTSGVHFGHDAKPVRILHASDAALAISISARLRTGAVGSSSDPFASGVRTVSMLSFMNEKYEGRSAQAS